jgi:hypothetical protein
MEKEFIPYEQALALKELGFDEPCFTYYYNGGILSTTPRESGDDIKYQGDYKFDNHQNSYLEDDDDCSSPLYQQAFRWFREKYQINSWIYPNLNGLYSISNVRRGVGLGKVSEHQTYEEAELECLKKLIEIVKQKIRL